MSPIEIKDWDDLDDVRLDLTEDYVLVNDIDENSDGYDTHASTTANDNKGWKPLAFDDPDEFTGVLDFAGYEIRDLFIDRPSSTSMGLIMGCGGTVKNGTVEIISVDGRFAPAVVVGVLRAGAEVLDMVAKGGTVTSPRTDGNGSAGGVVGVSFGKIERCFSFCDVVQTGFDGDVITGGLCGDLREDGQIIESGAEGDVNGGANGNIVGGLVGLQRTLDAGHNPIIRNCYARGSVTGDNAVGGLVGEGRGTHTNAKFTIDKSYSTGAVSGNTNVGGLLGEIVSGSTYDIDDSFWDTETSNQANSAGDETGKTTAQMKDRDTFTDTATTGLDTAWDMALVDTYDDTKIWGIGDLGTTTINNGYPYLMTFQEEPVSVITHTTDILAFHRGTTTHTTDLLTFKQPIKQHSVDILVGIDANYSRATEETLPATEDDLETLYDDTDRTTVGTLDGNRVDITGTGFLLHQFKEKTDGGTQVVNPKWVGQSTLATSSSTIFLQVYNHNTTAWENLTSDNTTDANTNITLQSAIDSDLGNYQDSDNLITFRIYQEN